MKFLLFFAFFFSPLLTFSQNYLHTEGQEIIDKDGNPIILRGYGLGGWMLMEGYMMLSASVAPTQHEMKEKITDLIGEDGMENFYEEWLANHVTKADVDSLKAWGYNSVRLPMHYNLYTLPIEDEPVAGQHTWLDKGFDLTDAILDWCEANEMYLILDLHAAPGGQGYDAAISDYDEDKPSLWESPENKAKTVALWGKLAERYADEEWIGGYDLINEVNWDLPGGTALRNLYEQITDAIRAHDQNHIIYIEGNWFANDFTGLTPPWDNNFVYSFHKYWSINDQGSIQWVLDLRQQHTVPLWCGETGENSNTWFREAIELFENNNIGWAWWPMKKMESQSGIYSIQAPFGYQNILDYWGGNASEPSTAVAQGVFDQLAENAKSDNCRFQKDIIHSQIVQPNSETSEPYTNHDIPGVVFMTDFDLGKEGVAYSDEVTANYHLSTGEFTAWNSGWQYRNDGVDIEKNFDILFSNDYGVGFTESGEWMNYTVNVEEAGFYKLEVRSAAGNSGGAVRFQKDGVYLTSKIFLPSTGSWQSWQTTTVDEVYLEAGTQTLRLQIENPGSNLNYFRLTGPNASLDIPPYIFAAETNVEGSIIQMDFQKPLEVSTVAGGAFTVKVNNSGVGVTDISPNPISPQSVLLTLASEVEYGDNVKVSYTESGVVDLGGIPLDNFTDFPVVNNLPEPAFYHPIPGKIEAEDYSVNNGFQFEQCTDIGGGQNAGYTDVGDYLEFLVDVEASGTYEIRYRLAAESQQGSLSLQSVQGNFVLPLDLVAVPITGGWQNWETVTSSVELAGGPQIIRLKANSPQYNINWIEFSTLTSVDEANLNSFSATLFPNPSLTDGFSLQLKGLDNWKNGQVSVLNSVGKSVANRTLDANKLVWNGLELASGIYFVQIEIDGKVEVLKWVKM